MRASTKLILLVKNFLDQEDMMGKWPIIGSTVILMKGQRNRGLQYCNKIKLEIFGFT